MKVHRLVIINRVADGLHLAGSENTTTLDDALDGICTQDEAPELVRQLQSGKPVRKQLVFAGIQTHVCLTSVRAMSREAQERSRATERPMSSSCKEQA